MPGQRLKQYLDDNGVKYVVITHSQAYTAPEIAQAAHIPGANLAKTVMVRLDEQVVMAVVRGNDRVDLDLLRGAAGATSAELMTEQGFAEMFSDCAPGAMPPFGNLYQMRVLVDEALTRDAQIAFNAGSHTELVQLAYEDFARLVEPTVARFSAG